MDTPTFPTDPQPAVAERRTRHGTLRRSLHFLAALTLFVGLTTAGAAGAEPHRAQLNFDPRLVLAWVARQMNVTLRPEVPLPAIYLESSTPLQRFQDAIAPQWHFRPPMFANAFASASNEIFLIDDPDYYERRKTTIDDSLAHEFAHYIQVHYQNADLSDHTCEQDAIAVQQSFSEGYRERAILRVPG